MAKRKPPSAAPEPSLLTGTRGDAPPPATSSGPGSEGYTVLARRYRPQQFADLVGQEAVAQALVNALQSNRVAHAYLFTGARGVGKTSTARILAKALNCVKGPTATPCDCCENCKNIAAGEDMDVLEIDAASNRGIDEIRELRQTVRSRTSHRSRYKIYIVDEVHMLTREAFNALLKTLEEPPPHVKFIFATTEVQKIPVTILSRCQRFDFAGIGTARIVERLRAVAAGEGMQVEEEALELVARRAAGSMRDAQSLLDQLLAFGDERLTAEQVHQLLGTAHDDRVLALASAILEHDPARALDLLRQSADEGLHLGELLDQLLDYWRDLMVVHCVGAEARDLSVPSRHRETLAAQAKALKLDTILAGLDILSATKGRFRGSSHGRTLLEMALVRLGRLDDLVSLAQLAQWLGSTRPSPEPKGTGTDRSLAPPARPPAGGSLRDLATAPPPEGVKKRPQATSLEAGPAPAPAKLAPETLPQIWREVMTLVGPILAGNLGKAEVPAISGPNTLVVRFPISYNAAQEHCEQPSNVAKVEEALRKVIGRSCHLRIETVAGEGTAKAVEDSDNSQSRYRRQRSEAIKVPLVKRAVEILGAQLVDVEEGFGDAPATPPERVEPADGEEA
jgi:DNA polymerase-3 subunit gamma/tau